MWGVESETVNTNKHTSSINKLTRVDKKGSSTYFTIA